MTLKVNKSSLTPMGPDMDAVSDALHVFLRKNDMTDIGGGWSRIPYRSD